MYKKLFRNVAHNNELKFVDIKPLMGAITLKKILPNGGKNIHFQL